METEKTQNTIKVDSDSASTTTTTATEQPAIQEQQETPEIAPATPDEPEPAPKEEPQASEPTPAQEPPKPALVCNPDVKSFEPKEEARIIKALSKFADYSAEPPTIEQALAKENLYFMETSQVCMVEAISEEAKRVLYKFASVNEFAKYPKNIIEIYAKDSLGHSGGFYSLEYINNALNLLGKKGYIHIYTYKDKPAVIESKHFRVFLAPCSVED